MNLFSLICAVTSLIRVFHVDPVSDMVFIYRHMPILASGVLGSGSRM